MALLDCEAAYAAAFISPEGRNRPDARCAAVWPRGRSCRALSDLARADSSRDLLGLYRAMLSHCPAKSGRAGLDLCSGGFGSWRLRLFDPGSTRWQDPRPWAIHECEWNSKQRPGEV